MGHQRPQYACGPAHARGHLPTIVLNLSDLRRHCQHPHARPLQLLSARFSLIMQIVSNPQLCFYLAYLDEGKVS